MIVYYNLTNVVLLLGKLGRTNQGRSDHDPEPNIQ